MADMVENVGRSKTAGDRVTVDLNDRQRVVLDELSRETGIAKADVLRKGLALYSMMRTERARGREFCLRNEKLDETQPVRILDLEM